MFSWGGVSFHGYGLLIGIGVWFGLEAIIRLKPTMKEEVEEVAIWAISFGLIGARAYHIVDYWQRYYRYNLEKIWAVWEGGLGIWGAIVGVILGIVLFGLVKKRNTWSLLNNFAIGAPIAQAIGRIGNWVNGELYGRHGEPLFAYEALSNLVLFFLLLWLSNKQYFFNKLLGVYLAGYGTIRIALEGFRPAESIWMIAGVPVAVIFGAVAILIGIAIWFLEEQLNRSKTKSR